MGHEIPPPAPDPSPKNLKRDCNALISAITSVKADIFVVDVHSFIGLHHWLKPLNKHQFYEVIFVQMNFWCCSTGHES